ncbi:hypothetical protein Tco_0878778 [Tanacetum coccineum]|uniref:Transposase (Putative), gypsy type n=1 Tax=Tanacetum coccineum TaxID=301880 RepID=A0ABQ5C1U4_9ASTR
MTHQCSCLRPLVCSPFTVSDLFLSYAKMDLFAFINHAYPTKVRIVEREVAEREGAGNYNVNEEGGDVAVADQTGKSDHIIQVEGIDIVADDETQAIVSDKPKRLRKKRKAADGASGSGLPPKKLREDHGVSGDASASTARKSLLLFKLEGGGHGDSIAGPNLRTQLASERFVVLTDFSHHSSTHVADDEVTSIVRSSMPPPLVLTAVVATTIIADVTSASEPKASTGQICIPKWNVTNDSALDDPDIFRSVIDHFAPPALFSQLRSMDYEQLFAEFNVRTAHQSCLGFEVRLRLEHELRGRKKFKDKCAMQAGWLKERDTKIASLKAQLSLKEAEAGEAIRLRGQVAIVEVTEAARARELNGLKERNAVLEGQVTALESAAIIKNTELESFNAQIAKLTQDLSNLQMSCNELSIKAASLESDKDKLIDQVSKLEGTCSGLCDEVMGYQLFKEHIKAVQDVQVKVLSDRVAELDANLMRMALYLDEEFYPCYLTTIVGRRWILSRGLKLVVMKCLQSSEYLAALGEAIGPAIDKGMQVGLATGIDHRKAGRDLTDVTAYDPSAEANYMSAVSALRAVNFPLHAQLESYKDASIVDLMGLLHLEGPAAETPEAI